MKHFERIYIDTINFYSVQMFFLMSLFYAYPSINRKLI